MIRRILPVVILAVAAACSADTAMPSTASTPDIVLTVDSIAMRAGDSISPTVTVTVDGVARVANSRELLVSSSDTSVIAVAANGALIAVNDGHANVTVAWAATPSNSLTRAVTVSSEDLTAVSLVAPLSMVPGDTATFVVTGTIRGGRRVPSPASVVVTSRNPAVVTASGNKAIAIAPGSAWIVANASTGVSDSSFVTVAVGPPVALTLSPHTASLQVPQTLHISVTMTDRRGNAVTQVTPDFSSTAPAVAIVQADGTVTGVSGGSALVIARAANVADTLHLTVTAAPQVLTTLVPTPDSVTLNPGGTASIQVQALDALGHPMALPALTWQSLTAGITVTTAGVIQAASSISTTISNGVVKVSSGSVTATVRVAVVVTPVAPVLARLVLSPDSVTLSPGGATTVSVTAYDTHNNVMTLPALTWQSLTSGISVTGSGVINAASTVSTTIPNGVVQVSSGSITAQLGVAVVVVVTPSSDNGYVQIRWVGNVPTASVAAAFEAARTRINGLFNSFNGVAAINPNAPANYCLAGTPALNETVKGIIIYAQVTAIDGPGGILGSAGPCLIRIGNDLPVVATMKFDSVDMNSMVASGLLNGVVLHEMMHTLGFGTIWGPGYLDEVASPNGSDPRYLGTNGQAGYAAIGGTDATGVPVENTGGSGTAGAHWRESVFHTELMTGWADGAMQMSRATVGALKDFGYDVDVTKADPFTLPASLQGASLVRAQQIVEQTLTPIGVVGPSGRITPYTGTVAH